MGSIFSREKISQNQKVSMEDFQIKRLIGRGRFGKVYEVDHGRSGYAYAMKILKKSVIKKEQQQRQALLERKILSSLSHPFLVSLKYAFQSANKLCLVMDLAEGGELFSHLRRLCRFSESWLVFYGAEILTAIEYIHSCNIVYRDLKPENILLDASGHIKLADFGLAKNICDSFEPFAGTCAYLAPEILSEKGDGFEVDLWTFGILLYELATGTTPFYHKNRIQMFKKIIAKEPEFPGHVSNNLADLIRALLRKNPSERMSINSVKNHEFFKRVRWSEVDQLSMNPPINPGDKMNHGEIFDDSPPISPLEDKPTRKYSNESYPDFEFVSDE